MMSEKELLVVIPAFNEEDSIIKTIKEIRNLVDFDILVIDDCSTDETVENVRSMGVEVLTLERNHGAGRVLHIGILEALKRNYSYAIQLDADGQHDPRDIKNLLQKAREVRADLVIGSRYIIKSDYSTQKRRLVGIYILSLLIWAKLGKRIHDTTSGYRLYSRGFMNKLFNNTIFWDLEAPLLAQALKKGLVVLEHPVQMKLRQVGKSHLTAWKGVRYFWDSIIGIMKL